MKDNLTLAKESVVSASRAMSYFGASQLSQSRKGTMISQHLRAPSDVSHAQKSGIYMIGSQQSPEKHSARQSARQQSVFDIEGNHYDPSAQSRQGDIVYQQNSFVTSAMNQTVDVENIDARASNFKEGADVYVEEYDQVSNFQNFLQVDMKSQHSRRPS